MKFIIIYLASSLVINLVMLYSIRKAPSDIDLWGKFVD